MSLSASVLGHGSDMADHSSLIEYVQNDHRICPRPMEWQELFELIGGIGPDDAWRIDPPLVLAAWRMSDADKRARFIKHLNWAAENGMLAAADAYTRQLPSVAWHHEHPGIPRY